MGKVVLVKQKKLSGCTRRVKFKGTTYIVSSVFYSPFSKEEESASGLKERIENALTEEMRLTICNRNNTIGATKLASDAGKESNASEAK